MTDSFFYISYLSLLSLKDPEMGM